MDAYSETIDGLWIAVIAVVFLWAAWMKHDKEVDEQFSPPDSAPPT